MPNKRSFLSVLIIACLLCVSQMQAIQPDTLLIPCCKVPPHIDGKATDAVWKNAPWIAIDQVWMPWKGQIAATDFSGRFRVLWSDKTNMLYFVAEITDDIFRDGYQFGSKNNRNYSEYDIFEVFLDPDRQGGLHVFDETGSNAERWGSNAENAFTYHISVNKPTHRQATNKKTVEDIAGTSWSDIRNYASHFPDFVFRKKGNTYTYEFSLKVYNNSYNPDAQSENSREKLYAGKVMGLATAWCDDDHRDGPPQRDNFIGSVAGVDSATESDKSRNETVFNQVWKNASYLGIAILTK